MTANHPARPDGVAWRPMGVTFYLDRAGDRLRLSRMWTGHPRVADNRQLRKIGGLTVEVCTNYFDKPRGPDGAYAEYQLGCVRATLLQCEPEIGKVFAIAAAAVEMVGEAYAAFGMEPPDRDFAVMLGAPPDADEMASLRAEVARLTAENESLTERLTSPNGDAETPHPHLNPHPHRSRTPARG